MTIRLFLATSLLLGLSLPSFAGDWELPYAFFDSERYGERVILEPSFQGAMEEWLQAPDELVIQVEYKRGNDQAETYGKRVSEWFVAFGVPESAIKLQPKRWLDNVLLISTTKK